MKIHIETRDARLPGDSRDSLEQRIRKKLGYLGDRVDFLRITLNASQKRGKSKECKITVQLAKGGQIIVIQQSRSMARALFKGLRRLCRLLKKQPRRARVKSPLLLARGTI